VYDEYKAQLMNYRKVNNIFLDLKSEAMKPRHWKDLLKYLQIEVSLGDLTLNHLWKANLLKHSKRINEVMA
jgi:hypothetical protein